jgi:hypothetical protein
MSDSVEERLTQSEREVAILKTQVQDDRIGLLRWIRKQLHLGHSGFVAGTLIREWIPSMPESAANRTESEREIRDLQISIDQSNLRRAAELSMAEKFKLGADLYDDSIRWLKQIIKAEQPDLRDEQVNEELDRRKAIKRRVEEAGLFRLYMEDVIVGEV